MGKAVVTVGLGFGDEGKGSAVDYLTRKYKADFVMRYNGGCQAAHNVVLLDDTHHCFRQFGAGTLAGAKTYLGRHMLVDPLVLRNEANDLRNNKRIYDPLSLVYINAGCVITTPFHALLNQVRERCRENRHGSCGMGIGETRQFWLENGESALFFGDLYNPFLTRRKLDHIKQYMMLEAQRVIGVANKSHDYNVTSLLETIKAFDTQRIATRYNNIFNRVHMVNNLPKCDMVICEGSQGVLLDEYYGFHPHTTWSTTTNQHAFDELGENYEIVENLGIIRSFHTRHGNGPLPSKALAPDSALLKEHNVRNKWQGSFKFGWLDMPLLKYAMKVSPVDELFVTCLDQVNQGPFVSHYVDKQYDGEVDIPSVPTIEMARERTRLLSESRINIHYDYSDNILDDLRKFSKVRYTSWGPTYRDKIESN